MIIWIALKENKFIGIHEETNKANNNNVLFLLNVKTNNTSY